MKIKYLIGSLIVLIGAIALVVLINRKSTQVETPHEQVAGESHVLKSIPSPSGSPEKAIGQKVEDLLSAAQIRQGFEMQMTMLTSFLNQLPESQREILQSLVDKVKAPDALNEKYKKVLAENFSGQELEHLNEIYRDRDMGHFQDAAKKMLNGENDKEYLNYKKTFDLKKLPADRSAALAQLVEQRLKTMPSLTEDERGTVRELVMVSSAFFLKDQSVETIRHIASQISDPIYLREFMLREKFINSEMEPVEQALDSLEMGN